MLFTKWGISWGTLERSGVTKLPKVSYELMTSGPLPSIASWSCGKGLSPQFWVVLSTLTHPILLLATLYINFSWNSHSLLCFNNESGITSYFSSIECGVLMLSKGIVHVMWFWGLELPKNSLKYAAFVTPKYENIYYYLAYCNSCYYHKFRMGLGIFLTKN